MPKAEKGSIKYLANKMKAKGLQKLRWYCQMCEKQCRDENGFKCHTSSESHQRQLLIFADNPNKFLGSYSKEFEDGFMNLLKRCHGTKRIKATKVYNEYINDRDHVHMNSTRWETLTGFVKYLGRTGKCTVDETEEGWFITWIDRDPETIARQERLAKKGKLDQDDEERMASFIDQQVQRARETAAGAALSEEPEYTELQRDNEDEKLNLDLRLGSKPLVKDLPVGNKSVFKDLSGSSSKARSLEKNSEKKKKSALEEIMEEEEARKKRKLDSESSKRKEKSEVKDYWLKENIVVKIVTKSLGDKYYKQKGYVKQVLDKFVAVVVPLSDTGSKIKLDQDHLETVVPAVGKKVLVVNGLYRREVGELVKVDFDRFCATIRLEEDQKEVELPYEHFSKLYK